MGRRSWKKERRYKSLPLSLSLSPFLSHACTNTHTSKYWQNAHLNANLVLNTLSPSQAPAVLAFIVLHTLSMFLPQDLGTCFSSWYTLGPDIRIVSLFLLGLCSNTTSSGNISLISLSYLVASILHFSAKHLSPPDIVVCLFVLCQLP